MAVPLPVPPGGLGSPFNFCWPQDSSKPDDRKRAAVVGRRSSGRRLGPVITLPKKPVQD